MSNSGVRTEFEFSLTTIEGGKMKVKMMDRINIDDVFLNLVDRQLHTIMTGTDHDVEIPKNFRDTLIRERFNGR